MKRFIPHRVIHAVCIGLALVGCRKLDSRAGDFELTIIHINDHHSHLEPEPLELAVAGERLRAAVGGYAALVHEIQRLRAESKNALVLHAGDALIGTLYSTLFRGRADAVLMNHAGFDFFTLGNHEFDNGNEGLKEFLHYLEVPVLSANVVPNAASTLHGLWKPSAIVERAGERIGVIGLDTVKKTVESSSPGKDINFIDEIEAVRRATVEMQQQGVNKIILLSHAGFEKNCEIAQNISGIDVIVSGDTHYLLGDESLGRLGLPVVGEYPRKIMSPAGEPVYVVEAWEYGKCLGELNVVFDRTGVITSAVGMPRFLLHTNTLQKKGADRKNYPLEEAEREALLVALRMTPEIIFAQENDQIISVLEEFKKEKEALGAQAIGVITGASMRGGSVHRVPDAQNPQGSVATRFVAETMLSDIQSFGAGKVDCVIQNAGGARSNIQPGEITYNDAYTLLPFSNTLVLVDVSGAELKQIIEDALQFALGDGSTGAFPYGAGVRYEARQEPDEHGKRVIKLEVQKKDGAWVPVDERAPYRLGVNSYIARGKDGYKTLGEIVSTRGAEDTYLRDAESL
ncbi:NAD nucleotidase, partial [Treponema pallidum]